MSAVRRGHPDMNALPPATQVALAYPRCQTRFRLRAIPGLLLVLLAIGAGAGGLVVLSHRRGTISGLDNNGVSVVGHVTGISPGQGRDGYYYFDDVTWTFRGHTYTDDDTMGPFDGESSSDTGSAVQVLVDPKDATEYSLDGYLTDGGESTGGAILLFSLAGVASVIGLWLVILALRFWLIARSGPFVAGTTEVVFGRRAALVCEPGGYRFRRRPLTQ